jgi:hypothetical protein
MNARERILAMTVAAAVLVAGGGFLFFQLFVSPLKARDASIRTATEDKDKKKKELLQAQLDHAKLQRFKALSLPGDPNLAAREYERFLRDLFVKSRFQAEKVQITAKAPDTKGPQLGPPRKQVPIYTTLEFVVDVTGKLENVVRAMESFYRTGLLHAIKNVTMEIPRLRDTQQQPDELTVKLTIDALIVTGADHRPYLLPNIDRRLVAIDAAAALRGFPTGLAWAAWGLGASGPNGPGVLATKSRKYSAIAAKNIFIGLPPEERREVVETTKYVFLTHIILNDRYNEAFLYDRYNDIKRPLRNQPGFSQVTIQDSAGDPLLTVKVVQIDARDLVFSVGDKYYSMRVGQNLADGMRQPLSDDQVEALLKDRAAASSK